MSQDISGDETYQTYLDMMSELEQEGKARMADEVIQKVISRMSPERAEKLILGLPAAVTRQLQVNAMKKMLSQQLQAKYGALPEEVVERIQKVKSEDELSDLAKKLITASSLAELGLS
ncbi:hypothetical protein HYR99_00575 [Candidatus Poribacteria bacterium]|nr:hypothetical protein [Candidatus Poribacteria bacterium]